MKSVPDLRIRTVNGSQVRTFGEFVLYWMIAHRRTSWNYALERAGDWSRELDKPLLILEALRCDYPYASDRLHQFVLAGMDDNRKACREARIGYYPYVEPGPGSGKGLLAALAQHACAVVTDDFPSFFLPRMLRAAGRQVRVRFEAVDSNGLLPVRSADRAYPTAYAFRRFLQKELPTHLRDFPVSDPLRGVAGHAKIPEDVVRRWPPAEPNLLAGDPASLAALPIDHGVRPSPLRGGEVAGRERLSRFVEERLSAYARDRNHPDRDGSSGLSPYLHFGQLSAHEVFSAVMGQEGWTEDLLPRRATGKRSGWWKVSEPAEAFLDQLVTWREVGFNGATLGAEWDRYESLPPWARATLERHSGDRRRYVYTLAELDAAGTHDRLWNAAQSQLAREGGLHNYLRMVWGKKILEWSRSPQEAIAVMLELNDRYALDGRDPNSLSGIFWCLGRYDRAWGPERPIFGTVRYMSSENTVRKVEVTSYLNRYAPLPRR